MIAIPNERLRERAREKVMGLELAVTQTAFSYSRAELEEELELARIALASLEAEMVSSGYFSIPEPATLTNISQLCPLDVNLSQTDFATGWNDCRQHALVHDGIPPIIKGVHAVAQGWNACRAAMQGKAEPVTTDCKLPDDFDFDRFNDVTWLEAVASNPHMHSPTTTTIAMVALEMNRKLDAGNSPVIPDGWVACSERMPEQGDYVSAVSRHGEYVSGQVVDDWIELHDGTSFSVEELYLWMPLPALPAAPQQEAKP